MVLAWTGDELSHGQAQNGVNFDFEGKFDLEGKGQSPPKTIGILTKVFYTCVSNLVILAWTGLELSRGQASDWHTDWHTHGHTHRCRQRQYPKAKTGLGQKLSIRLQQYLSYPISTWLLKECLDSLLPSEQIPSDWIFPWGMQKCTRQTSPEKARHWTWFPKFHTSEQLAIHL